GNAGTRVARNVLMMEEIPNEVMGRVDSLFRLIGTGIRIVLLMLFTRPITSFGISSIINTFLATLVPAFP
ncbi:hypothetical protein ACT453_61945, partial [Bacillus sp. D-CC]